MRSFRFSGFISSAGRTHQQRGHDPERGSLESTADDSTGATLIAQQRHREHLDGLGSPVNAVFNALEDGVTANRSVCLPDWKAGRLSRNVIALHRCKA